MNILVSGDKISKPRPTPPHLTSVLAEQLLARACENEADNAKRMRMGMEPVSQVIRMVLVLLMVHWWQNR